MFARIAAMLTTLLLGIAVGVVIAAILVVVMNGYGESEATWGLGVYALATLIIAVFGGATAYYFTGVFIKKEFSPIFAVLTSVPVVTVVAVVLEIVAAMIGVGISEIVRVNF